MILLQWHSGARPGEIVQMRPMDVDRQSTTWVFRPCLHKTQHHGRDRVIALGPRAQEAPRPFLIRVPPALPGEPLFSPSEAEAPGRQAARRERRKTPLWPSHGQRGARRSRKGAARPGTQYTEPGMTEVPPPQARWAGDPNSQSFQLCPPIPPRPLLWNRRYLTGPPTRSPRAATSFEGGGRCGSHVARSLSRCSTQAARVSRQAASGIPQYSAGESSPNDPPPKSSE